MYGSWSEWERSDRRRTRGVHFPSTGVALGEPRPGGLPQMTILSRCLLTFFIQATPLPGYFYIDRNTRPENWVYLIIIGRAKFSSLQNC